MNGGQAIFIDLHDHLAVLGHGADRVRRATCQSQRGGWVGVCVCVCMQVQSLHTLSEPRGAYGVD